MGEENQKTSSEPKWQRLTKWLRPGHKISTTHGSIPSRQWLELIKENYDAGEDAGDGVWARIAIWRNRDGEFALWALPGEAYENFVTYQTDMEEEKEFEAKQRKRDAELNEYAEHLMNLKWVRDPDVWLRVLRIAAARQAERNGRQYKKFPGYEEERCYEKERHRVSIDYPEEEEYYHEAFFGEATRFIVPGRKA